MFDIEWTIFLKVNNLAKAEALLQKIGKIINFEIYVIECEKYWKDPSLFKARVKTPLNVDQVSLAVFETLRAARKIAAHWTITGPSDFEGGLWQFDGIASGKISFVGIAEIFFEVRNYNSEKI